MSDSVEDVAFLTIRARRDPAFPGDVFLLVRTYRVPGDQAPVSTLETMSIDGVLSAVDTWLRNPDDALPVTLP